MTDIENLLRRLGVGSNYSGHRITVVCVTLVMADFDKLLFVTKELYPEVAAKCNCSIYSVERNIRTAAKVAWQRNPKLLNAIAQYPITSPPAASQFIDILAAFLSRQ